MSRDVLLQMPGGSKVPIFFEPVDQVGAEERAASFSKRSIKKQAKLDALYTIIRMIDLTTLEGADTTGKVLQMCAKAIQPAPPEIANELYQISPGLPKIPSVAAVCVYPALVPVAKKSLEGTGIHIASVATSFPSGQVRGKGRFDDVREAIQAGADEIDMVINRGWFLEGKYQKVFDEIVRVRDLCGEEAHLKVILETGELQTYDHVRFASMLAMEAGAHFIKTSTGKVQPAATMPVTLVMLQAIADFTDRTGKKIGMKPAGGIRTSKQAIAYLCMVNETLGEEWLSPDWFRFGASVLLNDVLKQIYRQASGRYYYDYAFSLD